VQAASWTLSATDCDEVRALLARYRAHE